MAFRHTIEVKHDGLGKYRVISGTDYDVVQAKARAQKLEWERKYQQILAARREKQQVIENKERVQKSRERKKEEVEEKLQDAEDQTEEAQQAIEAVRDILHSAIKAKCAVDWKQLKKHEPFFRPEPKPPVYYEYSREPEIGDANPSQKVYEHRSCIRCSRFVRHRNQRRCQQRNSCNDV
jgi:restriction system protein